MPKAPPANFVRCGDQTSVWFSLEHSYQGYNILKGFNPVGLRCDHCDYCSPKHKEYFHFCAYCGMLVCTGCMKHEEVPGKQHHKDGK